MTAKKNPNFWKVIAAVVVVVITAFGIGYRIYNAHVDKKRLVNIYPQFEKLIAVYSVLYWRDVDQRPPHLAGSSSFGEGEEGQIDCPNIGWGSDENSATGELFSCFIENVDDTEFMKVPANDDWRTSFSWESLFGYELHVTLFPEMYTNNSKDKMYLLRENAEWNDGCRDERGSQCFMNTYHVRVSGLNTSGDFDFITSEGYFSHQQDGTYVPVYGWVVYIEDGRPLTAGDINRFLQITLRKMGFTDTNLEAVVPQLEAAWMKSDRIFLDALVAELENVPDLTGLTDFLLGR